VSDNKVPDDLFKDYHELQLFFNSDHIRLHNIHQFLKEKGIFAFAHTTDSIAKFSCGFFWGIDSLNSLKKYADIKAYPKITGFVVESENNISLGDLRDYLNNHVGDKFPAKESTFISISEDQHKLYLKIGYHITNLHGYNIFKNETKEACIEVSKHNGLFLFNLIQNLGSDYSVVHKVINSIIKDDSSLKLKLVEIDLSIFKTTKIRHDFFLNLVHALDTNLDVLGLIKYNRNKASDSTTTDFFEDNHLKGSNETKILSIEQLIENLEQKGALVEGFDIVFHDTKKKHLFVLGLLAKEDKRKVEVGLIGDTKRVDYDSLEKIKEKSDIVKYESMGLNENEKQEIAMNMWNVISQEFYTYRKEMISNLQL
jgi:hypothetical protein